MRFQIIFLFILISVSCHSTNNFKVSNGGFHLDSFNNSIEDFKNGSRDFDYLQKIPRRNETQTNSFDYRGFYNRGSDASYYFNDQLFEDKIFSYKGGERKMSEVNDIISNLSSFIICGYTLIKSIVAIFRKIKQIKN